MKANSLMVLVGPSGAGKSTFLEMILKARPALRDVVTCTTRTKRTGESEGDPYFFLAKPKFQSLTESDYFVEWAEVHGEFYGTPRSQLLKIWDQKLGIIMDLDIQGARSIKKEYAQTQTIFISPPSIDVLRNRILSRSQLPSKELQLRLEDAAEEMSVASEFDYQIANDELGPSFESFKKLVDDLLAKG